MINEEIYQDYKQYFCATDYFYTAEQWFKEEYGLTPEETREYLDREKAEEQKRLDVVQEEIKNCFTIQQLIDELNKIENKDLLVCAPCSYGGTVLTQISKVEIVKVKVDKVRYSKNLYLDKNGIEVVYLK